MDDLVIGLLSAMFSEWMGVGAIIGAFWQELFSKSFNSVSRKSVKTLASFLFSFIIPFSLSLSDFILVSDSLSKSTIDAFGCCGCFLGKFWEFLPSHSFLCEWRQLYLVGWGMNSRGVMELVIAYIALTGGLISQELYSAIVFMTIVTTVTFPFVFRSIVRKYPNIMENSHPGRIYRKVCTSHSCWWKITVEI